MCYSIFGSSPKSFLTIFFKPFNITYSSQLLRDNEDALAPDRDDPLHDILKDLGPIPTVQSLIGKLLQMGHWFLQYTDMYTCTCTQEAFVSQHLVSMCRM